MNIDNETNEVLMAIQSLVGMIEGIDKKLDSQITKLDNLYQIVNHHDKLLNKLDLDSIPKDEKLDIVKHLKAIEDRISSIEKYNNKHRVVDSIIALFAILIGIYSYWSGK